METLLNHIAITSTLWTIIVLVVFTLVAVVYIADEKFLFLNVCAAVTLVLCSALFKQVTPGTFVAGLIVYILAGCGWVVFKWGRFAEAKIIAYKADAANRSARWDEAASYRFLMNEVNPAYNKSRIFHWLFYWPFSVIDWCISDLFKTIYDQLAKLLKAYTARLLARHNVVQPPSSDRL